MGTLALSVFKPAFISVRKLCATFLSVSVESSNWLINSSTAFSLSSVEAGPHPGASWFGIVCSEKKIESDEEKEEEKITRKARSDPCAKDVERRIAQSATSKGKNIWEQPKFRIRQLTLVSQTNNKIHERAYVQHWKYISASVSINF